MLQSAHDELNIVQVMAVQEVGWVELSSRLNETKSSIQMCKYL